MENESMIIDDLIILGRAVPERIRNGRTTICTAGYSPKHGFIRVYPTQLNMSMKQWSIIRVPLERNPHDTRKESWKIQGSKSEWDRLHEKIEVVGEIRPQDRPNIIANLSDDCVNIINDVKRSLGIVKPNINECYFAEQTNYDPSTHMTLEGLPLPKVKEQYPIQPRIKYRCSDCKTKTLHDQQVLEWGFYEWFRKHPDNPNQVWENARIHSDKHHIFFLVGNLFQHRTSFLIIGVLRLPKVPLSKSLFPFKKC